MQADHKQKQSDYRVTLNNNNETQHDNKNTRIYQKDTQHFYKGAMTMTMTGHKTTYQKLRRARMKITSKRHKITTNDLKVKQTHQDWKKSPNNAKEMQHICTNKAFVLDVCVSVYGFVCVPVSVSVCLCKVCGCVHGRACVGEWQCPHRRVGGVFWEQRGVLERPIICCFCQLFWDMISFLGKLRPVGHSGW